MSGAALSLTFQVLDEEVRRGFDQLGRAMTNTTPLMRAIGVGIVGSTHMRFVSQKSPDGQAWQTLNQDYAETKRNSRILTESGRLRDSINARATSDEVRVGTNVIYGGIHQLGGTIKPKNGEALVFRMGDRVIFAKSVTLPARPYLGISSQDETMVAETVFGFLERYARR
ncbi:phage virion morphogenesis protein [Rhizobium sp. PDO1-076]|uniref:phage virion morphogenesis protein n=1 Tax=Rhizobium sp. PDO1-076 TaxID=1125979 RepID=UPI00024E35C5|nr:phage virion morphogenesis protein [Rhizobium sp. PDO1-076]EHS51501.1 phage virion morphogenesis protein [Rhizobium sp. PDO1-076]